MIILVTGVAGFIGSNLARELLKKGEIIVGIDSLNDYYDVNLKLFRLEDLNKYSNFTFIKCDIADKQALIKTFDEYKFDVVVNLAAQAGVRYSITNPDAYIQSN